MRISFTILSLFLSTIIIQAQNQSLNMTLLSNWDVDTLPTAGGVQYNDIWGYVDCDENEYAIMGSASRIHFIDLRNPSNATEIASFPGGQSTIWRDMKTYRDRAYAVSDNTSEGLMIFDLSNLPDTVSKSYQSTEFFGRSHNIFIDEPNGRLYSVGTDSMSGGIVVLDIATDPDNPVQIARVNLPANPNTGFGYVHDIYVRDNIAYCSHGFLGYFIWDLTDPNNPILLASQNTGGYNHSSWVSEDGTFAIYAEEVPTGRPLGVMNLENLDNEVIEIDLTFKFPLLQNDSMNTPHNPFLRGDLLICSYYEDGLQVFDVSDPLNPIQVAYYDTYPINTEYNGYNGNWGTYPFLPSGLILASDIVSGLFVLQLDSTINMASIETPSVPNISSSLPMMTEICEGDSLIFEVPDGYNYIWKKDSVILNETSNILFANESGNYSCTLFKGACESISNVSNLVVNTLPDLSSLPNNNTVSACEGDVLTYSVSDTYDTYVWMENGVVIDSTNEISISTNGTYQLIATSNNCTVESAVFTVEISPLPEVSIMPQGPTEFCQGNFLNLFAETNANNVTYEWKSDSLVLGADGQISVTESGTYELNIINSTSGCSANSTIDITVFQPVVPQIDLTVNTLTSTPASYYQWFLDGVLIQGANDQTYEISEVGEYHVGTADDNNCFSISNKLQVSTVSTDELENVNSFSIYPNPVNELLSAAIELETNDIFQLEIISANGLLILEKTMTLQISDIIEIETTNFAKGIYFLKIRNEEGQLVRKFVKM